MRRLCTSGAKTTIVALFLASLAFKEGPVAAASTTPSASAAAGANQKATTTTPVWKRIPNKIIKSTKSTFSDVPVNFSGIFASQSCLPGHERASGVPVYMVTTPWGSPYMIFENEDDIKRNEIIQYGNTDEDYVRNRKFFPSRGRITGKGGKDNEEEEEKVDDEVEQSGGYEADYLTEEEKSIAKQMEEVETKEYEEEAKRRRNVALFFMDHEDATCLLSEMKQMGPSMKDADIRITATSMARALRSSTIFGKGMPTGGINDETGETEGQLRYKIVPSSKQLYYASRCRGKARVGFFEVDELGLSNVAKRDMKRAWYFPSHIPRWTKPKEEGMLLTEILMKEDGTGTDDDGDKKMKNRKARGDDDAASIHIPHPYEHMKGKTGVPVFYVEGLRRSKGIPGFNRKEEIPLFFSYEDCVDAWKGIRQDMMNQKKNDNNMKDKGDDEAVVVGDSDSAGAEVIADSEAKSGVSANAVASTVMEDDIPEIPNVEVFNFVDVVTSIDREQHKRAGKRRWLSFGKEGGGNITSTERITFVPPSSSVKYKDSITAVGGGKARLRPMRKRETLF